MPNCVAIKSYPGLPKFSFWNCGGYPSRRGPGLGPIVEGRDIICLTETHEHDGCKILVFDGYLKLAVWNKVAEKWQRVCGNTSFSERKRRSSHSIN